ncbi:MAG: hypothetical protein HC812_04715 [Leptolyngbya sp. RL_3_1]|nr:hypothetical protein [Leptolyngbya sp. RL_3_1]
MVLLAAPPPGSLVKKGDVVAEFDRQYMLTRLDDYKAGVAQTEAAFKKLEAELELGKKAHTQTIEVAKANHEKAKLDMRTLPVRSAMDAERFRLALEEAEAQLKQIQQEFGMAVIFITHDLDEAVLLADRVVVLATIRGLRRIEQGNLALKQWQIQVDQAFSQDAEFEGASELARLSGCDIGEARQFMAQLPGIFPHRLYRHQALGLVRVLIKARVQAKILPLEDRYSASSAQH